MEKENLCGNTIPEMLIVGIDQFNRGEYFDCHETLEELWVGERGPERNLYQGILQVAVALHHLENGNFKGALILLQGGPQLLRQVAPVCRGVDLQPLLDATDAIRATLEELGEQRMAELPRAMFPRIRFIP
jgi:hypothetical protein